MIPLAEFRHSLADGVLSFVVVVIAVAVVLWLVYQHGKGRR